MRGNHLAYAATQGMKWKIIRRYTSLTLVSEVKDYTTLPWQLVTLISEVKDYTTLPWQLITIISEVKDYTALKWQLITLVSEVKDYTTLKWQLITLVGWEIYGGETRLNRRITSKLQVPQRKQHKSSREHTLRPRGARGHLVSLINTIPQNTHRWTVFVGTCPTVSDF